MADSDDEDDLWAEFDDDDSKISVSANLLEMLGRDEKESIVHKDDADAGRITWVPPTHSGLTNSSVVSCKTQHWNHDETSLTPSKDPVAAATTPWAVPAAPAPAVAPPIAAAAAATKVASTTATPPVAQTPATATSMFTFDSSGRIQW